MTLGFRKSIESIYLHVPSARAEDAEDKALARELVREQIAAARAQREYHQGKSAYGGVAVAVPAQPHNDNFNSTTSSSSSSSHGTHQHFVDRGQEENYY